MLRLIRVTLLSARGRAALAAGDTKDAAWCAKRLQKDPIAWAKGLAELLRAGVASTLGRSDAAVQHLDSAIGEFRTCDVLHYAAAARYRRGQLTKDVEPQAAALDELRGQGIVAPETIVDVLAPGVWPQKTLDLPEAWCEGNGGARS